MAAYECEALPELEATHEGESQEGIQSAALRNIALAAARSALRALQDSQGFAESEMEGELEEELNPIRRVYPDAMLEHLGHLAAQAESEQEAAEAFLPLIPLVAAKLLPLAARALPPAAKSLPKVASTVSRLTPPLARGVTNIARTLFRSPATRSLMRTVPTIAQRTLGTLARQVASGQPVTAQTALRTLARQTAGVLSSPRQCTQAVRRSRMLDRQFHRAAALAAMPAATCPTCGARVIRPTRRT